MLGIRKSPQSIVGNVMRWVDVGVVCFKGSLGGETGQQEGVPGQSETHVRPVKLASTPASETADGSQQVFVVDLHNNNSQPDTK